MLLTLAHRVSPLSYAALSRAAAEQPPAVSRLWRRAWLLSRPWRWLVLALPDVYHSGFPDGPKRDLIRAFAETPAAAPGRPPISVLAEQGRGLGKTNIARGVALHRLLEGLETGLVFAGATIPEATKHTKAILALGIPPVRASERPSDPAVRRWLASPLGSLYPDLRYTGSVTEIVLHLDGRAMPIWTIAPGSSTRGKELSGTRPSLAICDDLVTLEAATSETQAAQIVDWVEDDVRGLGTTRCPCAIWWLGNAIASGDSLDLAAASGRWKVVRGAVWTPHAPPRSPEKSALLAELLALPTTSGIPESLIEAWTPRLPSVLQGATPTDPDTDPFELLRQEALTGERAFARAFMCVRLSPGASLWPMSEAHLVRVENGMIIEPEGKTPLAQCKGAVWLDPRGSEAGDHGDYAAAAGVVRAPSGRRHVLVIEAGRVRKHEQRALYWRCVDELLQLGCASITGSFEGNFGADFAFGEEFGKDAVARRARGLPAPVPTSLKTPSSLHKYSTERLDRVTDHIADGRLRFRDDLTRSESWRRMALIPQGHDDDADALERADWLLTRDQNLITSYAAAIAAMR